MLSTKKKSVVWSKKKHFIILLIPVSLFLFLSDLFFKSGAGDPVPIGMAWLFGILLLLVAFSTVIISTVFRHFLKDRSPGYITIIASYVASLVISIFVFIILWL